MTHNTILIALTIMSGSIVAAAIIARRDRPAMADAAIILLTAILLRLGAAAAFPLLTGEQNLLTRPAYSDELVFLRISNDYFDNPGAWRDELLFRESGRFAGALHALRLLTPDASPMGLRFIGVVLAASGIAAVWAATRRRFGPRVALWVGLLGAAWPYSCWHDVGIWREPWMTFGCGWAIAMLAFTDGRPGPMNVVAACWSYFLFLLQPHAGICSALAYLLARFSALTARLPGYARILLALVALGGLAAIGGVLAMQVYYDAALGGEALEGFARDRWGGSAFWTPGPAAPLWMVWITNSIQYWLGGLFISMGSASRLLGLVDYAFWLPMYGIVLKRLRDGTRGGMGVPEKFAATLFIFYNILSMGYVINVGQSIRKRNAVGVTLLYVLGAYIREPSRRPNRATEPGDKPVGATHALLKGRPDAT